jgi:hypothetical protein
MNAASESNLILEIGAEGGSIKVLGRTNTEGVAEYSVQLRDQTLTYLTADEAGQEICRDFAWTESWDTVIKTLGRWPWPMLYPLYVHPDFRERVLSAVQQYEGRDGQPARASAMERWSESCRPGAAK